MVDVKCNCLPPKIILFFFSLFLIFFRYNVEVTHWRLIMVIRSLDHPSITRECKDNNLMGAHHPAILCVLEPKGVVCEEGKIELGFFMQQSDSQTNADLTKPCCCLLQSFYSENIRIYLLVILKRFSL